MGPAQVKNVGPLTGSTVRELQQMTQLTKARTLIAGTKRMVGGKSRSYLRIIDTASGELLFVRP